MGNSESGCFGRRRSPPRANYSPPYDYRNYPGAPPPTDAQVSQLEAFTAAPKDVCRRVLIDCGGDTQAAAARLLLSGGREIMCCTLPEGAVEGDSICVTTPRGPCTIVIPPGYSGGMTLTFHLPRGQLPVAEAREVGASLPLAADGGGEVVDGRVISDDEAAAAGDRYVNADGRLVSSRVRPPAEDGEGASSSSRAAASAPEGPPVIAQAVAVPVPPRADPARVVYVDPHYVRPMYGYRYGYRSPYYYDPFLPMAGGLMLGSMLAWPLFL